MYLYSNTNLEFGFENVSLKLVVVQGSFPRDFQNRLAFCQQTNFTLQVVD